MKKILSLCILAFLLVWMLALPLSAFTGRLAAYGFYGIASAVGATVTPGADARTMVVIPADVNGDGQTETFFAQSDMLTFTYTGAVPGARGSVLLYSGHPARGGQVFYADQITAVGETVTFLVRPVLPDTSMPLFLHLSWDTPGSTPVTVPLHYAAHGVYGTDAFATGDVNGDDVWNSLDALLALQIGAEIYTPTPYEQFSANVNGDGVVNSADALMILQYGAGLITSWD